MSEFKGSTYESTLDLDRLSNNLQRVYVVMSDGQWHTHEDLEKVGGLRWSARVRDLRGSEWGPLEDEAERVSGGVWRYRLVLESITPHIHDKIMNRSPDRTSATERDERLKLARRKIEAMSDDELREFIESSEDPPDPEDFFDLFSE